MGKMPGRGAWPVQGAVPMLRPMYLNAADVEVLALGCTFLGAGGGGSVAAAAPLLRHTLEVNGTLPVVSASALDPDASVACVGAVGSSTVMLERLPSGVELAAAVRALERHTGTRFQALQPLEIGGVNGLLGLVAASRLGLPAIDGDAMGRAYPRLDHTVLMGVVPASPLAVADAGGDVMLVDSAGDRSVERLVRAVLPAMGAWAAVCLHAGTAGQYARHAVPASVSRALTLGRAWTGRRREDGADFLAAAQARLVFTGTVLEIRRTRSATEISGVISLGHACEEDRSMRIDFANEYVAAFDDGVPVSTAPDITCVLDARTWEPVSVERLAVQQRVRVIRLPAPEALRRPHPGRLDLGLRGYGMAEVRTEARP